MTSRVCFIFSIRIFVDEVDDTVTLEPDGFYGTKVIFLIDGNSYTAISEIHRKMVGEI